MAAVPPLHAGDTYWLLACSTTDQGREGVYSTLRSRVEKHGLVSDSAVFDVPQNFKFGSFDELIRLADDLAKYDVSCEQVVRRMERTALEVDPSAELRIIFQRNIMTFEQYLHRFTWDDAKFPRTRQLRDNLDILMSSVTRMDDEVRIKGAAYNEAKQSQLAATKAATTSASLSQKDLVDVLHPEVVDPSDFIETEHLTTVIVVVPSEQQHDWMRSYERLDPFVVPSSAKKFEGVSDSQGNTLWRVVLFKKSVAPFRDAARLKRCIVREFKYNPSAYKEKMEERNKLDLEKNKQESFMSRVCLASFSDACIAWVHLKAMRIFTESVLRYGVPPRFSAYLLKPNMSKEKKLRKELEEVLNSEGSFGHEYIENANSKHASGQNDGLQGLGDEEAYYSYVWLSFVPLQLFTQK